MSILRLLRLPDILSLLNGSFGFSAVVLAFADRKDLAIILVLLAAAWDGIDGYLARRFGAGPLGVTLDSLADLVSFGVAPPLISIAIFPWAWWLWLLGSLYLISGMLRLARFNALSRDWPDFQGLPITAAGVVLTASLAMEVCILTSLIFPCLTLLMASSLTYPKIRDLRSVFFLMLAIMIALILGSYFHNPRLAGLSLLIFLIPYLLSPVVMPRPQIEK